MRAAAATAMGAKTEGIRLADCVPRELVDDIFAHALKKQTGVSLKYMLDFGSNPIERQLVLSSQFLHKELPVRLAHRVAELENLPYGLSSKSAILKVSRQQQLGPPQGMLAGHTQCWDSARCCCRVLAPTWALPACRPAHSHIGVEAVHQHAQQAGRHVCACLPVQQERRTLKACMPCVLRLLQVRDWYVESFNELRSFPRIQVSRQQPQRLQAARPRCAAAATAPAAKGRDVQQQAPAAFTVRQDSLFSRAVPCCAV